MKKLIVAAVLLCTVATAAAAPDRYKAAVKNMLSQQLPKCGKLAVIQIAWGSCTRKFNI